MFVCFSVFFLDFFHHHLSLIKGHDQWCFPSDPNGHPKEAWKSQGFMGEYAPMRPPGMLTLGDLEKMMGNLGYAQIDWDTRL